MLPRGLHFPPDEFRCHDGTPYPEEFLDRWIDLRDLSDGARIIHGSQLFVISGFRTPAHNADLIAADEGRGAHGVASSSQHIEVRAGDFRSPTTDAHSLYSELLIAWQDDFTFMTVDVKERRFRDLLGGIGVYPESNWVHLDTLKATDGHLRRWRGH